MNRLVIVRQIDSYDVSHHEQSTLTVVSSLSAKEFEEKLITHIKEYSEKYSSFNPEVDEAINAWEIAGMENTEIPEAKAFVAIYDKQQKFKNENRILELEGFKFDLQDLIIHSIHNGNVDIRVLSLEDWFNSRLELSRNQFYELFQENLS